jgi:hypothetical protein
MDRNTVALCVDSIWAVAADIILKHIFGRAWPDPGYVQNHLYGFHLLRGETTLGSFPSGTAAISAAIASVLWIVTPRWRVLGLLLVVLLLGCCRSGELSLALGRNRRRVLGNVHWLVNGVASAPREFYGFEVTRATPGRSFCR